LPRDETLSLCTDHRQVRVTSPASKSIARKVSLAGAKNTGWKPMLLYAIASSLWVRGDTVMIPLRSHSKLQSAM
jgi:hypothetical protein